MAIIDVILFIAGAIVVATIYAMGFGISDFGGVLLSWRILGRGVAGVLGSGAFLGCRLKRRAKLALSSNHCSR